jgi:hypothetical protein
LPQELEGPGNHYHFVLPEGMAVDAPRLLAEVAAGELGPDGGEGVKGARGFDAAGESGGMPLGCTW